jgi:arylformamidase
MPRIIDLTLPLDSHLRGVSIEPAKTIEKDGWNATTLHLYSHCSTHMDAPTHFGVSERTIDQVSLDRCMGPAWVVDPIRAEGVHGTPYERACLHVADLGPAADKIERGDGLLLRTGWSRYVDSPSYRDKLPRVSLELAQWCVAQGVRILGVEPPSVADVNNLEELTAVHKVLLQAGVVIVEGLANLDQIREERVTFMALPLKVAGGDGAPVRALALED